MQLQHILKSLIFLITIVQSIHCIEINIRKTNNISDDDVEPLTLFHNKTYEMPLFQTRYVTIQIFPDEFRSNKTQLIGIKFQVKSTDIRVVEIEKQIMIPRKQTTNNNNEKNILLEDLFIFPNENALRQIFNVYPSPTLIEIENSQILDIVCSIKSMLMDETNLTLTLDLFYNDETISTHVWSLNLLITQPKRIVDKLFYITLPFLIVFVSIQMGILLDSHILLDLVKNPKPVIIGFISQYGIMPFLAMSIAKIFHYSPLYSLALFVIGCCPGSGASNQWTLLFDGDVNLSAVMSFVSTSSSFFMMPLYFYTIGQMYMKELSINVPFLGLVRSLLLVVLPYGTGIVISHFSPKTRSVVQQLVKPMMLFLLLFFLIFGTIVNWYLIRMIDLYTALTAPLLPYLGFIFGGVLAWIFRLSWTHIKTVGIEAGIQNTGIAFMIIFYSFPQPYATKAIVVPLVVSFFTTKPFWLVYVIRSRIKKYQKRKSLENNNFSTNLNSDEIISKEDTVEMRQTL